MRVLIIKMSSMGDIIHTLPALTDAGRAINSIQFDWIVEENFQEIPRWHPLVRNVIPIALRRWRKNIFSTATLGAWTQFAKLLRSNKYDLIIDAQGLLKSCFVALLAKGQTAGPNFESARDPIASLFYKNKYATGKIKKVHAVTRARNLFSKALGYEFHDAFPDYGIQISGKSSEKPYLVFLHGTTWTTKHWPEDYWITLAKTAITNGYQVKLPWGNKTEQERAERIASISAHIEILPKLMLHEIATVLASAQGIVSMDTGLGHLAAALDIPTVSLYGPTDPVLSGALGRSQKHLRVNFACAPCFNRECTYQGQDISNIKPTCFTTLPPTMVWSELEKIIRNPSSRF